MVLFSNNFLSTFTILIVCGISKSVFSKKWEGNLVFSEEFDGNFLRKHYWDYDDGCEGKGYHDTNLECFKKGTNNVQVENGTLVITARLENSKEYNMGLYRKEKMLYTSGKIIQSGFGFTYGTYVIRARFPKGKHLSPSIYIVPMGQRDNNNCKYEEIDIVMGRGQRCSTVQVGAHYGRSFNSHESKVMEKVFRGKDFSTEFHEFAIKWSPTRIEWFVDSQKIYEVNTHYRSDWVSKNGDNIPNCGGSSNNTPIFGQRSALVLSLSVGGEKTFPETKYGKLSPEEAKDWPKPTFEIDSIRVYDPRHEIREKLTVFDIPGIDGLDVKY